MSSDYRQYAPEELGRDGYPKVWHERLKHEVRERAGYRCVRCGHPYVSGAGKWSPCDERCTHAGPLRSSWTDDSDGILRHGPTWSPLDNVTAADLLAEWGGRGWIEAQWRILTVHHLVGKSDCRWFTMAALCQRCHLAVQGKVVMERAFIFEHSDWFKEYAAGWYAWKYEGREVTREEAAERMEELLALERLA